MRQRETVVGESWSALSERLERLAFATGTLDRTPERERGK